MNWPQQINPFGSIFISASVALIPIAIIFWALIVRRMKGYQASALALCSTLIIAILAYKMPAGLALLSAGHGAMYGLFPICWIVIAAVFMYNISVKSGQLEIIKHFISSITPDKRLQLLLIAFSFGSFLEGTAGFGAPVVITASMLIGLGFNPLYAGGLCLIANTVPVAFGSIGIPITVASHVSSIPEMAISQMVGRTLPIISFILPFYLVLILCGFRKTIEIWPAALVSGGSFAVLQWFSANYLSPMLPDVIAGIGSILSLIVFLRFWKPGNIWKLEEEPNAADSTGPTYSNGEILKAWSPFIILTVIVIAWGIQPVKELLNSIGLVQFNIPVLHNSIQLPNGTVLPQTFKLNYLAAGGTAIFISAIISLPLIGMSFKEGFRVFISTIKQLRYSILTVATVMSFAFTLNNSGMSNTLAAVLANTGILFPFFAPVLGWLGVFITGSDTSSNALFGKLQYVTATSIGIDPVVTVSANVTGGVIGKMISPQSIAVAATAGHLSGKESALFRFAVKHSFLFLFFISLLTLAQAYLLTWLIPRYEILSAKENLAEPRLAQGGMLLLGFAVILILIAISIKRKLKKDISRRASFAN